MTGRCLLLIFKRSIQVANTFSENFFNLQVFTIRINSMNTAKLIVLIGLLQLFTSCSNTSDEEEITVQESATTTAPVSSNIAADTNKNPQVVSQPISPVTAKAALNPAHGQPGHRCDIAVGAPLDSKPTQQTINATPQPVAVAQQPTQSVASGGGVGLNPAHGQPGHRCDIAVGAPLNSKPTQPAINANPQPIVAPVNQTPKPFIDLKAEQSSKAGLNPAHGQPGHRCDIAVGAPLNSKPAQ